MFLDQTWPNREMVIVDDLDDRSFDNPPDYPGVRYFVLETRLTVGEKRNIAASHSIGDIICHWDSDDVYRRDRIEHQVMALHCSDADIVGYAGVVFESESGERQMYTADRPLGASLCYWKRVWQQRGFPAKQTGEEYPFLGGRRVSVLQAEGRMTVRTHAGNTSPRNTNAPNWKHLPAIA